MPQCQDAVEPLAKKDNDDCYTFLTQFFMLSAHCDKESNEYYSWKCVSKKCKEWKDYHLLVIIYHLPRFRAVS